MNAQVKSFVENCPFCERPVIFRQHAGFINHLEACQLRDGRQEVSGGKKVKTNQSRGPLMTRAYQKILNFSRASVVNANRKKFTDEWNRIDDYWKDAMIVCPECYSFKIPADEKVRPCPHCKCLMEWAKDLVESDPRFNFVKEFCAGD